MGQHPAQRSSDRRDALVFQQVDEPAQSGFVLAEGEGAIELRRRSRGSWSRRPSPISKVAPARRSPHTMHCGARVGWMCSEALAGRQGFWRCYSATSGRACNRKERGRKKCFRGVVRAQERERVAAHARSRRVRVSVSRLLKTALRSPREARPERSYVAGASGPGERWLTLVPIPKHRDSLSICASAHEGAMLDEVPVADSRRFH